MKNKIISIINNLLIDIRLLESCLTLVVVMIMLVVAVFFLRLLGVKLLLIEFCLITLQFVECLVQFFADVFELLLFGQ